MSLRIIRVQLTGFANLAQPAVTYPSLEPFISGPRPASPSLKSRADLMYTTTTPRDTVSFLKSSPISMSFKSSVRLLGATYSASAASIDDCTKEEMRGTSMRFRACLFKGTHDKL